MKTYRRICVFIVVLSGTYLPGLSCSLAEQKEFPSRHITWIVPYPAGGANDAATRIVAQKLAANMGQAVVVENRAGAGGLVGTAAAVRSAPDGYTLVTGSFSLAIEKWFRRGVPYDAQRDLTPVMLYATVPSVLVVTPELPVKDIGELIALAKAHPKKYSYASAGRGTSLHLAMAFFASKAGLEMLHVPYSGSAPALIDLLGGRVHMMFDSITAQLSNVETKQVRALGVTSASRAPLLPDVPTIAESGLPGFEMLTWFGVFVPTGTTKDIVDRLNLELNRAVADPKVQESLAKLGLRSEGGSADTLRNLVKSETDRWGVLIEKYKLNEE